LAQLLRGVQRGSHVAPDEHLDVHEDGATVPTRIGAHARRLALGITQIGGTDPGEALRQPDPAQRRHPGARGVASQEDMQRSDPSVPQGGDGLVCHS
jgi:hypothetical protein